VVGADMAEHPARRLADRRADCGDDVGILDLFGHSFSPRQSQCTPDSGASCSAVMVRPKTMEYADAARSSSARKSNPGPTSPQSVAVRCHCGAGPERFFSRYSAACLALSCSRSLRLKIRRGLRLLRNNISKSDSSTET